MKSGIIIIYINNFSDAEKYLKISYLNDKFNDDILFNIIYMKINKGELEEAKKYCKRLITITKDNNLKDNIYNILNDLEK